jgi:membrane-bound lytic murein transglycosylase F
MWIHLAVLSIMILYVFCSDKNKESDFTGQTEEKRIVIKEVKDSIPEKKVIQEKTVRKKKIKNKNPIYKISEKNKLFNATRWLKSDHDFLKRTNPKQISEYDPIIKKFARRYGFDWRLIAAQIYTESNFKFKSKSRVGAIGLMQIMPNTAKYLGYNPKSMINPQINIAVGCMYDQRLYSLWGRQTKNYNRLALALASYNAGRGRVLKSYNTKESITTWADIHPLLPKETQSYVHKIYLKHEFYKKYFLP